MSDALRIGATLELELHPDDLRRLQRHPALQDASARRNRGIRVAIRWDDAVAAAEGLAGVAAEDHAGVAAEDGTSAGARFDGRDRCIPIGPVTLTLRSGAIHVGATEHPSHRLSLLGPPAAVAALAARLATDLRVQAPTESLAAIARRLAGGPATDPPLGAPEVRPGSTVAEAFAQIAAQLTATIRHWCARIGQDTSPEPVHQARVAVRRLRSALALFRSVIAGPEIEQINQALRDLATRLGAARDWDVFLAETAAPVQTAFAGDPRLKRLGRLAAHRRDAAYAALTTWLASQEFRTLGVGLASLAMLRPWAEAADPALLAEDITGFAARSLTERRRKLVKIGKTIADLQPEALHTLRKRGKKFRYGCEFFAPLFPKSAKRTLRRLAKLQETLGHLNDGATAATLLAELGNGRARSFASGAIHGFTLAKNANHRSHIQQAWAKFRRDGGFWEK